MDAKTKKNPTTPPDGQPRPERSDRDSTSRSRVSEVQDPAVSGDAGGGQRGQADEPQVDEAGNVRKPTERIDLLH